MIHDLPGSSALSSVIQLTELTAGCSAKLHSADLADEDFALLEALGICRCSRFRVCQAGNPWILQVNEARIGLSAAVASRLRVLPEIAL